MIYAERPRGLGEEELERESDMTDTAYTNDADQLIEALTNGPTPALQEFEVLESGLDETEIGAWARIQVGDQVFLIEVAPEFALKGNYDIGYGIPGRVE